MKYIIVEDNEIDMELAVHYASLIPELELAGKYSNPVEAFSALNQNPGIELILCDIDMPHLSGIDFIKTLSNPPQVIFLTYHQDMALEGFEVDATDYLVKPYTLERFMRAIRKAIARTNKAAVPPPVSDDHFYIRADQQFVKIQYNDVLFIEALKDYIKVVTKGNTYLSAVNLGTVEDTLPASIFFRAGRSLLINVTKIESLDNYELRIGGHSIALNESVYRKLQEHVVSHKLIKR